MYCIHKVFLDVRTAIDARSKTGSMLHPEIHGGTTLDENSFRSALRYIRPKADELTWQAIPWQTDVFEAMRIVRQDHKPVLLWAMKGDPLGCT